MSLVTSNNVKLIVASPVGVADTSITLVSAAGLPDVSDPADWTIVTLIRAADNLYEIIRVDSIAGTVLTVQRAQEGTAALTFQGGDALRNYFTSGMFDQFTFEADTAVASAAAAAISETNAANSESTAVASAAAAAISETNSANSETNAGLSAANAATSETNASLSAANALTSETNAGLSAANALTSETNALTSETNAAISAANAATSETNAGLSAANALTSETNAATSETNAGLSAAAALVSETNAATSELNADTSASNALTSANNAATSETNAATSETNAASSAAAALVSETNAAASAGGPLNEVIDGQFNHWYSGTSTSTPGYATDIWGFFPGGGTATVSRQAFTLGQVDVPGSPKYYLQYNQTVDGTGVNMVYQRQANCTKFAGSNITISVYGKVSSGTLDVAPIFAQNFGTGGSPSSTVATVGITWTFTTAWQKFTDTIAVPSVSGKTLGTDSGSDYWDLSLRAADLATTFTAQIANLGCSTKATGFNGSWLSSVEERSKINAYVYNQSGTVLGYPHNSNSSNRDYSGVHPTTMVRVPSFAFASATGWSGGAPSATASEVAYRLNGSAAGGVNSSVTIVDITWDARY